MEEAGFVNLEVERLSPAVESMPSLADLPERVREEFFGAMDYSICRAEGESIWPRMNADARE